MPEITIENPGDYTESGFSVYCRIDSAGTIIYSQSGSAGSISAGRAKAVRFPSWQVGPVPASYRIRMWHDCASDQNRLNDTLETVATASDTALRVAIEIATASGGRTRPNACYEIDSLCNHWGWSSRIVAGPEVDELAELERFSVLVTGDVGFHDNDFPTYQAALRQWVEAGGGLVGVGAVVYGVSYTSAWLMDSVLPTNSRGAHGLVGTGQIRMLESSHHITRGVGDFNVYHYAEYAKSGLRPGAVMLGDYSSLSGTASIAIATPGAGRSVYLGPFYFGAFQLYNNEPYFTDPNSVRLLRQAIEWAAGQDAVGMADRPERVLPRSGVKTARPNPFSARTEISLTLPASGRLRLFICDASGRIVRTLDTQGAPGTESSVVWDRTDEQGLKLPAGVYLLRLSAADRKPQKLVVQR